MTRDLRIVFMGTPDFAVTILDAVIKENYKVVGVITAPDKPAGRGRKIQESAVKRYAITHGLKILQPKNLKNLEFLEALKALNANLQIVVAFRMLPQVIWQMPEYGTFNLHASLLPQYRGAAPINWAIINGEQQTGVTTFFIDEKIDTGEMILQEVIEIKPNETAGQLHDKLMHLGSDVVIRTIKLIASGKPNTTKQKDVNPLKTAPKLTKENSRINWEASPKSIVNLIRGLNPYPLAWTTLRNGNEVHHLKIYKVHFIEKTHNYEIGKINTSKQNIDVAVRNGMIRIDELKLQGKRKMNAKDLLNGFKFSTDSKML
jgi:methionyl-tRNA formyltransferase